MWTKNSGKIKNIYLGVWAGEEPTVQNERSEEGGGESGNAKRANANLGDGGVGRMTATGDGDNHEITNGCHWMPEIFLLAVTISITSRYFIFTFPITFFAPTCTTTTKSGIDYHFI